MNETKNYKVWLVRSPELSESEYWNVLSLLQSIPGVIKYHTKEEAPNDQSEDEKNEANEEVNDTSFEEQPAQTHQWFFDQCIAHRNYKDVGKTDMVICLSSLPNTNNYFLKADENNKLNAYVQTSGYENYFPGSDVRYPVAYHIAVTVLMMQWFEDKADAEKVINYARSKGGILDFCNYKKDVILKLRTADLSSSEIESLKEKKVDPNLIVSVLDILEKLRGFMLLKKRFEFEPKPLMLTINTATYKFYFEDLGNIEVPLNDVEKAYYLVFLKHVRGIDQKKLLENHEAEMFKLYNNKISSNPVDKEDIENDKALQKLYNKRVKSIKRVCQSYSEFRNTVEGKFELAVGPALAKLYAVGGATGHFKKISLDRKYFRFVNWKGDVQPFQYVEKRV
jgi:hypothetical protein